jgi:hypothetical protein
MLGDILSELGLSLVGGLISPSTDRERVALNLALSVVAMGAEAWAFFSVPNPLHGPAWVFCLVMFGFILGVIALVFSTACLVRLEGYRAMSGLALILALLAVFGPLSLLALGK